FVAVRFLCFFFQAEDGIRDRNVTGVQTCALPICSRGQRRRRRSGSLRIRSMSMTIHFSIPSAGSGAAVTVGSVLPPRRPAGAARSEERRVGQEGGYRW